MALYLPAHSLRDAPLSPVTNIHTSSANTFATATTKGWTTYSLNPLTTLSNREFPNGSLKIVLPLGQSNITFLVGGPPTPLYPPNKVLVWDDKQGKPVAELEFREDVKGLAARRDRLVVVFRKRVVVFGIGQGGTGLWREGAYETTENPSGLVALATAPGSTLLAFPGRQPGQVQLVRLPPLDPTAPPLPPPPSHDPTSTPFPSVAIIIAHESHLSALTTTPSGAMLATTSSKGTLVRIWDAANAKLVKELRRGTDSAAIFGISLRADGGAVAVSSDKGTVHVWDLKTTKEERRRSTETSDGDQFDSTRRKQLSILKPYLPKYFSSEWSHSQFRLPPPAPPASRLPFSLSQATEAGSSGAGGSRSATPTVEDDVCICSWIEVDAPNPVSATDKGKGKATAMPVPSPRPSAPPRDSTSPSSRRRSSEHDRPAHQRRSSIRSTATTATATATAYDPPPPSEKKKEHQIVALTHSGGWFRISFGHQAGTPRGEGAGGEGGGGEGGAPSFGLGKGSTRDCRLEEYRRFGSKDGW